MRSLRRNALAAALTACLLTPASASECLSVGPDNPALQSFFGNVQAAMEANDPAAIYDHYQSLSGRKRPQFRAAAMQVVSNLLDNAFSGIESSPPNVVPFATALIVLSNLDVWTSCDTQADVRRIATATKALAGLTEGIRVDLDAEATAAIQRAEGQLSPLLQQEHSSPAEVDATIASLVAISNDAAFEDTGYLRLVETSLANKRQEAVLWHVGFDTPIASIWAKIGDTANCAPENLACIYLRDANRQLDGFLAGLAEEKSDPGSDDYFLYNDFILLRALNAVLANQADSAEALIRAELIESARNREVDWFRPDRPLDHIYVYKFLRDPDEVGDCVDVSFTDGPSNRCPVKDFFNPVQLGQHMLEALVELKRGGPEKLTPQALDSTLRQFANHDYRVVLDVFSSKGDPESAAYPDHLSKALREQDAAAWKCPADSRPLAKPSAPTICLTTPEPGTGYYEGYYFVGGNLALHEAESLVDQIAKNIELPIRPYARRPLVKG